MTKQELTDKEKRIFLAETLRREVPLLGHIIAAMDCIDALLSRAIDAIKELFDQIYGAKNGDTE